MDDDLLSSSSVFRSSESIAMTSWFGGIWFIISFTIGMFLPKVGFHTGKHVLEFAGLGFYERHGLTEG